MINNREFATASLESIKQRLDPAYCYIVFEKAADPVEESPFGEVLAMLDRLGRVVRDLKLFQDDRKGSVLLVAKFDPGRTDRIVEEILDAGLPGDVVTYAYGSSS
jgi:hypothetical protein